MVEFDNLLIIRPRFMGDLVLATGLATAAKAARPKARVTVVSDAAFAALFRPHPAVDQVVVFETSRRNNLLYQIQFILSLRTGRYDAVLDLWGNPRTAQWTFFSGAPVRVGYRLRGRTWAYNRVASPSSPPLPSGRRKVTEAYLDQWRALGYEAPAQFRTSLVVTPDEKRFARSFLDRSGVAHGEKVAALSPGASHQAKHWPLKKFMLLAKQLSALGVRPLFLFGPKDQDLAAGVQGALEPGWLYLNQAKPSLRELIALVEASNVLISNDAGPMHVGPAVGTPTVGIFGPGEPEIWFPYGAPHQYAQHEVSCSHCGLDRCSLMACMDGLAVEDVLKAVKDTGAI